MRRQKSDSNSIVVLIIFLFTIITTTPSTLIADDYEIKKARADAEWQAKKLNAELEDLRRTQARLEVEMQRVTTEQQRELNGVKVKKSKKPIRLDDDLYEFYIEERQKIEPPQSR